MFSLFSKPDKIFSSMSTIDILKRALYLYKNNFALLAGIALPGWILIIFTGSLLGQATSGGIPNVSEEIPKVDIVKAGIASISGSSFIFFFLFSIVAAGAIAISKRMLGQQIKAGLAYKNLLNRFFPLLGSLVLAAIIIGLAFTLPTFILPMVGIISGSLCYVYFYLVSHVVMLEGEGGVGAMKRAKGLISGYFKKTAILLITPLILQTALMILVYSVIALIHLSTSTIILTAFLTVIIGTLTEPFKILISILLYYDLRITKEGYDLELMEKELAGEL